MIMTLRGNAAKLVVALAVVCFCTSTFDWAGAATLQGKTVTPKPRLSSPRVGDTLIAGERSFIRWTVDTEGINVPFCEQEIFLILDNGKSYELVARELGPDVREFEWTVPNRPTPHATLSFGAGCDQRPFAFYEGLFPQTRHVFQILPPRESSGGITLKSLKDVEAQAGDEIEISWESSVDQLDFFEIKVSYDRGLRFHSIGKTSDQKFTWTVPEDVAGIASFKVIARKLDGTRVESWGTSAESQLKVRDK
jgi:hypothetical protein